ncbi:MULTISPECIES: hypothetical protein [unclassified Microbacterium]|uniref:hypothetical protein n=1 Tax=unclassified Microbacterium TaxID=2609290 RepID=UPI00214B51E9|nr:MULTISPECIES: hypothetical protein [unclassified Microbacterium]MCR2784746.1 hypothetical protein [Microbacterium sp. zg.B96]WIM16285.1 hypothetical protein QNO11_01250 [Microbacterium sp. zg-B96]
MSDPVRRRHSPAVYRRRRLLVLLAAIVVIAGIVLLLVWQPWNAGASGPDDRKTPVSTSTPTSTPTGSPAPSTPPMPSPEASASEDTAGAVAECEAAAIEVAGLTDKDTYAAGENPQLSISLTNNGGVPCTINVGTTTQTFTISSGDDVWWRSTDCQTEPSDQIVTIDAGQSVTSAAPLTWDRTRSSVSTCGETGRQSAPGGGSSFHLRVAIGGIESTTSKQFLLH